MPEKTMNHLCEFEDLNPAIPITELRMPNMYPAKVPSKNVRPSWVINPLQKATRTILSMKMAITDTAKTVRNQYLYFVTSCLSPRSRYALARSISSSPFCSMSLPTATLTGPGSERALQVSCTIFSKASGVIMRGCGFCCSIFPPLNLSCSQALTLSEVIA